MDMYVKSFIIILAAVLVSLAAVAPTVANAEAGNPPALDLVLESTPKLPGESKVVWSVTVHNLSLIHI